MRKSPYFGATLRRGFLTKLSTKCLVCVILIETRLCLNYCIQVINGVNLISRYKKVVKSWFTSIAYYRLFLRYSNFVAVG